VSRPIWSSWPNIYYWFDSYGLVFLWGAPSDERTGLSSLYAAGPCQRSHSQVRVPWYSRPYFTVSDLRLFFSSPPTTHRVTMEVFDSTGNAVPRQSLHYCWCIRCCGKVFTEPLPKNECLLCLRYSGIQASFYNSLPWRILSDLLVLFYYWWGGTKSLVIQPLLAYGIYPRW
jgi:hypothetical protein